MGEMADAVNDERDGEDEMREGDKTASFDNVVCKKATDKALLVVIEDEDYWIPLSHVHDDSEVYDDADHADGKLVVSEWIAQQKGLVP